MAVGRLAATAPIRPLAWEPSYAEGVALKSNKKKKKTENKEQKTKSSHCGSAEMNPSSIHEDVGWSPGLTEWVKDLALL